MEWGGGGERCGCPHRFLQTLGPVECVARMFPYMPACDTVYPSMCCVYVHA